MSGNKLLPSVVTEVYFKQHASHRLAHSLTSGIRVFFGIFLFVPFVIIQFCDSSELLCPTAMSISSNESLQLSHSELASPLPGMVHDMYSCHDRYLHERLLHSVMNGQAIITLEWTSRICSFPSRVSLRRIDKYR